MKNNAILFIILLFALLAGCAKKQSVPVVFKADNASYSELQDRFTDYWQSRANKNIDKSFEYENPYFKFRYKKDVYSKYVNWFYSENDVEKYVVKGLNRKGKYLYCFEMSDIIEIGEDPANRRDCWIKVNGTWYHYIDNPVFFP